MMSTQSLIATVGTALLVVLIAATGGAWNLDRCPVTNGTDMPVKERLVNAPIVVHASVRAAKSSVGYAIDKDTGRFKLMYGKGYYYRLLCVLKNEPGAKIRPIFSVGESGWATCQFHTRAVMASDVLLTLNVTRTGRLTFYDHDQQAAGHDATKVRPADVLTWLGMDGRATGPSCP